MSKVNEKADELRELRRDLGQIEMEVTTSYTIADAIREGSLVSKHNQSGWGDGATACALTAGVIAARERGFV